MLELIEFVFTVLFGLWLATIVVTWFRFELLPHGQTLFILAILWPLLLFDELLRLAPWLDWLTPLVGLFYFVPALLILGLMRMLNGLLVEKAGLGKPLIVAFIVLIILAQMPMLFIGNEVKTEILQQQPVGRLDLYFPIYVNYWMSGLFMVGFGIRLVDMIQTYQKTLSDQVVDVNYYKVPAISGLISAVIGVGLITLVLTTLTAFAKIDFVWWQSTVHLLLAGVYLVILILLLERRRYSPLPIDLDRLARQELSDDVLKLTLAKAERAMIERKAYKVIGLRLRQLADAAKVDPTTLAIATRILLNRNFRAFVYHYRLEYARKVLMRSDAKVSAVAKRLGFHSERFLSDVFIKYIEKMGGTDHQRLSDPSSAPDPLEASLSPATEKLTDN